eukprot:jgi/Sobl393_1/12921/SZX78204.1
MQRKQHRPHTVLISTVCSEMGNAQSVLMLICTAFIVYYLITTVPYYYDLVNAVWGGLWLGILYTCVLLVVIDYTADRYALRAAQEAYRSQLTWTVLYGIFPAVLLGAGLSWAYMRRRRAPLAKLVAGQAAGESNVVLKDVYRFKDVYEAELLLRAMRKWDEDGVPDPATTALGEFIMKCAMARLPNQPYLLTIYSNFIIEVRKDGQAARTQIQLAGKNSPSLVERYFIYVSQDVAKKLKSESEGLDLIGYVEFQRSYRACVRAHKLALQMQRQFWHSMLRDSVSFRDLQACLEALDRAEKTATAVYRRVLERYPANGKLLKVYGRFLEYVRNDPWGASKFYAEAMKQGTAESLLSLAGSSSDAEATVQLTALLGNIDEKNDGIVIINASGIIMMVNNACSRMFGYEKGELDGKNVSTMMPQSFSTRHNGFLQRYVSTGTARILNSTRMLVALHKDRSVFPILLAVQKLSGVGADAIFMGVLRNRVDDDPNIVRVWTTPAGVVLCADERFRDWFGLPSGELVGRPVSGLSTDIEGFDRFIAAANELPLEQVAGGALRLRTKLLHKYLAPIEAEATVEHGGTDDQRILVVSLRVVADSLALLVTDAKGRIHFATSQLGGMIGYSSKALTDGMSLAGLLPLPYSQLHSGFMKDLSAKPPPGSCRSGAVVHLQHANGSKVPVTLQLSNHDDGEHMQHVIKVLPASEAQLLDQQRLELQLNHRGVVLAVNPGTSKAMFGFAPQELVGRRLAAFVNLFGQWRGKFGEDESLLVMLGMRAEQGQDVVYRCGVHTPFSDEELARGAGASAAGANGSTIGAAGLASTGGAAAASAAGSDHSLLVALKSRHKERPAVLTMSVVHASEDADGSATAAAAAAADVNETAVLSVSLWRAEGLTALVEVDGKMGIARAEPAAGLMFGVGHGQLLRKSFRSLVNLPAGTGAADLLSASGKKSMLKEGAAWKTGPVRTCEARHMDEAKLKLSMQAVSKDGKTANRLTVMLRLLESTTGSLAPLLALRNAGLSSGAEGAAAAAPGGGLVAAGQDSDSEDEGGQHEGRRGAAAERRRGAASPEEDLHNRLDSRLRVEQWVSNSFNKREQGNDAEPPAAAPQRSPRGKAKFGGPGMSGPGAAAAAAGKGGYDLDEAGGAHGYVEIRMPGRGGGAGGGLAGGLAGKGAGGYGSLTGKGGDLAVGFGEDGGGGDGGGSVAGGSESQSAGGSEALDAASSVQTDVEDELVADWRRAKRLKKLNRMMTSTAAQLATDRWRRHTYMATAVIVVAHVICFVVLLTQINARYQTAYEVGDMAQATERSQMVAMRTNFIQKCGGPDYAATLDICNPEHVKGYIAKMNDNYNVLRHLHQGLYLNYWTYNHIPEYTWFKQVGNRSEVLVLGNTTLWEMGNKYLRCSKDVQFNSDILKYALGETNYWNYIYHNGPGSLFSGYMWSLDVFVDYAWAQLGTLNNVLVVLLIVEAVLVQLVAMSYEFVLLKAANCEAMKRFSVFLALPSATIRSMAARQMQVDDDDRSDIDDDELEAINATAAAAATEGEATTAGGATGKDGDKQKSVRMSVTGAPEDDVTGGARKKGAASKAGGAKGGSHKPPKSAWQRASKLLFGWANTTFKVNGKKLLPHNAVLWRFMVPLLLWVAAVIIIFGVSFQKLQGLQGPLASLNAAAHVRFRFARCRLIAQVYGFSQTDADMDQYRVELMDELHHFKAEYEALMYGGTISTLAEGLSFDPRTPAAAFANEDFSNLFFKTQACLRADKSTCLPKGDPYYDITHSGLDAMVSRYIDQMTVFAALSNDLAFPNHTSYQYVTAVGAMDMYDGLQTAAGLFVDFTISRFEEVKQLHIILLVCTLVAVLLFVTKVFRPHVARLHAESKAMAGMMSQLPAEVDIEGHVKQHVLGLRRDGGASLRMGSMGEPGGAGNSSMIGGMGLGGMEAGRRSMPGMLLPPPPGGKMGGGVLALAGHYGGGGRGSGPGMAMGGMDGGGGQWEDDA